jgi:regulator of protease activity HflC (stomatin/prohibitin superfamily)
MPVSPGLVLALVFVVFVIVSIAMGVRIVPQGMKTVIERLGKFHRVLNPGLNIIIPYIDRTAYQLTTKDIVLEIPPQEVITKDNAVINTNAICFINIVSPEKASYGVDNYTFAVQNLVQTSLRSIIGEMALDESLSSRELIKARVKESISDDVADWGIVVKGVEIQDINPSPTMQQAMEQQAAAERTRRATVTEADGLKEAFILEAEGKLEAAKREAQAKIVLAEADRDAIARVTESISDKELPAMYLLGQRYINAIRTIGEGPNAKVLLLPADLQSAIKGIFKTG